jgi:hypothetical protein
MRIRWLSQPPHGLVCSPLRDGKFVTPGERDLQKSMIYLGNTISGPVTELFCFTGPHLQMLLRRFALHMS